MNNVYKPFFTPVVMLVALLACQGCEDSGGSSGGAGTGGSTGAAPDCDALLTSADFERVCGSPLTLSATPFEGIELNPCHRDATGDEVLLFVTEHPSPTVAQAGASVAGGRGPTAQPEIERYASAGAIGNYAVEVKTSDRSDALCAPDTLPELLDIALSRF